MSYQPNPWLNMSTVTFNGSVSISSILTLASTSMLQAPYISTLNVLTSTISFVDITSPRSINPLFVSTNNLYLNSTLITTTIDSGSNITSDGTGGGSEGISTIVFNKQFRFPPSVTVTVIDTLKSATALVGNITTSDVLIRTYILETTPPVLGSLPFCWTAIGQ